MRQVEQMMNNWQEHRNTECQSSEYGLPANLFHHVEYEAWVWVRAHPHKLGHPPSSVPHKVGHTTAPPSQSILYSQGEYAEGR